MVASTIASRTMKTFPLKTYFDSSVKHFVCRIVCHNFNDIMSNSNTENAFFARHSSSATIGASAALVQLSG